MASAVIVLLVWFLTFATFHVWFCNGSSSSNKSITCFETERQALLKFKQDLKDPSNRLSSWAGDQDCCHWAGVVCHNFTGHVHEIHLQNPYNGNADYYTEAQYEAEYEARVRHRLGGKINRSLLDLKHLHYLDLSSNDFGGTQIPSFIGSIASLRYLNLSGASLGGTIPPQLGNLTKIRYLDLASNSFGLSGGNLQWLSGLVSLQHLDMSVVNLRKASDWLQVISNLPSLVELHLSDSKLNYHVSPFSAWNKINFTSLAILDLSYNEGLGPSIPGWISNLNHLVSLNIRGCNFEGLVPSGFQNMTYLRVIDLSFNVFNSTIPNWLYTLTHLESLNIQVNNLQGVISSAIENLTSLNNLDLSLNALEGGIPTSLGKLCNLKSIDLSSNDFVDRLPNELGQLKSLVNFNLRGNSFSGPIPMSIGRLSSLITLDLSYNKLNGTLPESLGQLAKLKVLNLYGNSLNGIVSDAHFANLVKLRYLDAGGNSFTLKVNESWNPPFQVEYLNLDSWQLGPPFPSWLVSQRNLTFVSIAHTRISDSIPIGFWSSFSQFDYVNFSRNQIHGDISSLPNVMSPDSAIDLSSNCFNGSLPLVPSNLGLLDLSNNSFSGSIYYFLCGGKGEKPNKALSVLNLGSNLLSGIIPNCWTHWGKLEILKLDNNNLSGIIPSSIGYLRVLASLHLRHNNLSGKIPRTLQNCTTLSIIDLGENKFTGSIPPWMGNSLSTLIVLNLRSNNFLGDLPHQLCHLSFLQILDVAHNNLSGPVPRCFANLSAMAEIHSSSNTRYTVEYSRYYFPDNALLVTKGRDIEYSTTLQLVTSMDLSENNLSGEIPEELTRLVGLWSLNLSGNHLTGRIPRNIGDMRQLESLDFSLNQLSSEIPSTISNLAFLSHLNLSYNNLTGRIPSSTQLQSLNESSFVGNNLCGPPLAKCNENNTIHPKVELSGNEEDEGEGFSEAVFLATIALGFAVGFWIVWGPLLFKRSWRLAYFQMVEDNWHKLCGFIFKCRYLLRK